MGEEQMMGEGDTQVIARRETLEMEERKRRDHSHYGHVGTLEWGEEVHVETIGRIKADATHYMFNYSKESTDFYALVEAGVEP